MLKNIKITFSKRQKYILVAALNFISMYVFAFGPNSYKGVGVILGFLVALFMFPYIQYTSISINSTKLDKFILGSYFRVILLPVALVLGTVLALISFPNLSYITKLGGLGIAALLTYLLSLLDNIVLVVFEKGETIPLFRVASTWVQILSVIIAIPLFSGFFKLPINGFIQSLLVGIFSILFTLFFLWVVDLDPDIPPISRGEQLILSLMGGFVAFCLSLSVSFLPTEAFLRALFCSSSMMSLQSYFHLHYKNLVTKKLTLEYAFITISFLLIVLIFQ